MAGISQNWGFKCLKYFPGYEPGENVLNILLISSSQIYLEEMQKHLHITRQIQGGKRLYKLKVHICKQVEDVLKLVGDDFTVDFVAFILDVNNPKCFTEIINNLNLLHSSFRREKMCIVNPNPSFDNCAVKPFEVWDFAQSCQINLIIGKIHDPERVMNLSKRVLNLAEACCGVVNGLPLVGLV